MNVVTPISVEDKSSALSSSSSSSSSDSDVEIAGVDIPPVAVSTAPPVQEPKPADPDAQEPSAPLAPSAAGAAASECPDGPGMGDIDLEVWKVGQETIIYMNTINIYIYLFIPSTLEH